MVFFSRARTRAYLSFYLISVRFAFDIYGLFVQCFNVHGWCVSFDLNHSMDGPLLLIIRFCIVDLLICHDLKLIVFHSKCFSHLLQFIYSKCFRLWFWWLWSAIWIVELYGGKVIHSSPITMSMDAYLFNHLEMCSYYCSVAQNQTESECI